jgi:beta-mannosidase
MNPAVGDTHLWFVWHGREPFEWYRGRLDRFCSEFGFQSFPEPATLATFTEPQDRNITSYVMEYHQRSGIGNSTIIHYLLDWFRLPTSFESGIWLSQIQQGMAMKYACEHWRRNMPRTMGTLYWQLNDCWAAPSWSSIDVFGRWKALHYMAKNFFAPLLISGLENAEDGTVEIHLTSDLLQAHAATVRWQVVTADGKPITSGTFATSTPINTSQKVETLDLKTVLDQYTVRDVIVYLQLEVNGEIVSDNLVLFARPKHLQLVAPEIKTELVLQGEGRYDVRLTSTHPALWVWLSTSDGNLRYSDNFFHLMPGQTKTVSLSVPSGMTFEALHQVLRVASLIDTYREVVASAQHV